MAKATTKIQIPRCEYPPTKRAVSIRQPFVELILRRFKKTEYGSTELAEVRNRPTRIVGRTFYIYAARSKSDAEKREWSTLTPVLFQRERGTGVIVGTGGVGIAVPRRLYR